MDDMDLAIARVLALLGGTVVADEATEATEEMAA